MSLSNDPTKPISLEEAAKKALFERAIELVVAIKTNQVGLRIKQICRAINGIANNVGE